MDREGIIKYAQSLGYTVDIAGDVLMFSKDTEEEKEQVEKAKSGVYSLPPRFGKTAEFDRVLGKQARNLKVGEIICRLDDFRLAKLQMNPFDVNRRASAFDRVRRTVTERIGRIDYEISQGLGPELQKVLEDERDVLRNVEKMIQESYESVFLSTHKSMEERAEVLNEGEDEQ